MAMGYPDKVLRPDSLNLTLDQNKHLAPDIGANQAGLLSSLRDLLQNIATSMGRSSGWSITKGVSVGVCIHIHIHHIHARTYIYIYITIAQPVSYLFYFIPLRPRIIVTTPSDSTSRLENRGVTGLETDMERA